MAKMRKSILALLLVATFLCALLTGCGGGSGDNADKATEAPAQTESDSKAEDTDQAEKADADDELDWPRKSINMIIPAGTSGDLDPTGRAIAQGLERYFGVNVVVTNVSGSGGTIGSRQVKDSEPDGYTFLYNNGQFAIAQATGTSDFGLDSFEVCCLTGYAWGKALTYNAKWDFEDLDSLIAYTKEHPYELTLSDSASTPNQILDLMLVKAGAQFKLIDLGSTGDKNAALMGGNVDFAWNKPGADTDNLLSTGKVKALCVAHEERCLYSPDLPTTAEMGYPSILLEDRQYVLFPKGTDPAIVEKMAEALEYVVTEDEEFIEWREEYNGTTALYMGPEETAAWLQDYYDKVVLVLDGSEEIYEAMSK